MSYKVLFCFTVLFALSGLGLFAQQVEITEIEIVGTVRTKDFIIKNSIVLKEGDQLSPQQLQEKIATSLKELNDLGSVGSPILQQGTTIDVVELGNNQVKIVITAKDRWTFIPFVVPGFDTTNGFSLTGGFADTNFLGLNMGTVFLLNYNRYDLNAIFGLTGRDSFTPWYYRLSMGYRDYEQFQYDSNNTIIYDAKEKDIKFDFELAYDVNKTQTLQPYVKTALLYKGPREIKTDMRVDPVIEDSFLLLMPGIKLGRVLKEGYQKTGIRWSIAGGVSVNYTIWPESYAETRLQSAFPLSFGNKAAPYHIKRSFADFDGRISAYQNNLIFPTIAGSSLNEIQGNWGGQAKAGVNFFLAALFKESFLLDLYLPLWFETANAGYWKESRNIDQQQQFTVGSGLILNMDKISLPINVKVGYNITKMSRGQVPWYYSVDVRPEID